MRSLVAFLIVVGFSCFVLLENAYTAQDIYESYFPKGVQFGMSARELLDVRTNAVENSITKGAKGGMFGAVEIINESLPVVCGYVYHFKEGKLAAVVYSRATTNMLQDTSSREIYKDLKKHWTKKRVFSTAKKGQLFNVEEWQSNQRGIHVCLEANSKETVITFYDPQMHDSGELFSRPEERERQKVILQGKADSNTVDRLSPMTPAGYSLPSE